MTALPYPDLTATSIAWAVLALAVACRLYARHYGHPFTAIGRAKLARHRRLRTRTAELIARGMTERDARRAAETDVRDLAAGLTYELRRARAET
jgi:hypothetical protein